MLFINTAAFLTLNCQPRHGVTLLSSAAFKYNIKSTHAQKKITIYDGSLCIIFYLGLDLLFFKELTILGG
jgi:hypothetical protein